MITPTSLQAFTAQISRFKISIVICYLYQLIIFCIASKQILNSVAFITIFFLFTFHVNTITYRYTVCIYVIKVFLLVTLICFKLDQTRIYLYKNKLHYFVRNTTKQNQFEFNNLCNKIVHLSFPVEIL